MSAAAGSPGPSSDSPGALRPGPRRLSLQVWVEPAAEAAATRVTVELEDTGNGATVASKTVAATSLDEAATLVAGYVARQVFERDPLTPPWCYGASDGHDLGVLQLARRQRVDATDVTDLARSRQEQIAILRKVADSDRCAGLIRYELAQLLDLRHDHLGALRLHGIHDVPA